MECWNCKGETMEWNGRFYACKSCGATYTQLPHLQQSPLGPPEKAAKGSGMIINRARPSRKKAEKKS